MRQVQRYLGVALLALLVGCASLGVPEADTFNKKAAVAYSLNYEVKTQATTLFHAGKITKADAQRVLDNADIAAASIESARKVHATNPADADNRLAAIRTGLLALQTFLLSKKGGP